MRIIAGAYKGRNLKSPPSLDVRPTSDRLRETLFNVIAPRIEDVRFLDLCAGSGAVGIEALSRGAAYATFVDRSRRMCMLIEANAQLCRIPEEQWEIYCSEVNEFLKQTDSRWDIVFFDPPYKNDYVRTLELIEPVLNDDGLLIAEHHHKTKLPETVGNLNRTRILKQGDSSLSFYSSSKQEQL
ncbi:MAG TPA: 16S rRNA (guanine(966)-N(2))-methyltransferase RsmD [Pyrinomonadaceae bacterium]|jgi:16S rRNA (guanine(966)-N(2))-methyltransferase RsmD|nr:16S rRNA (guanine(966)-N(2))-methyltransferase RsmD [Pyrinomonadaceae bacterium]